MESSGNKAANIIRKVAFWCLAAMAVTGGVMVFFQVKPFWVDEWFIIDNLKSKTPAQLLGRLHFLQQFPRAYLVLFRQITAPFHFGYRALRLPSFMVSLGSMILGWRLCGRLFGKDSFSRYLFILIIASSNTFTEYFVEVKQYPMDIFMSLVAIWQLLALTDMMRSAPARFSWLLCFSLLVAPFVSYTYCLAAAPLYLLMFFSTVSQWRKGRAMIAPVLLLLIGVIALAGFWLFDGRQLATDRIMYDRWSFVMVDKGHWWLSFIGGCYTLFAQTGSGFMFELIFGILGILGFLTGIRRAIRNYSAGIYDPAVVANAYSTLIILLAIGLFAAGKLPLGNQRLNSFTTASIAILIILLLNDLAAAIAAPAGKYVLPVLLYAGVIGNIVSVYVNYFTGGRYKREMAIYTSTQKAITEAQQKNVPILVTRDVAYPYQQAVTDAGDKDPAVWVLKTFPAYNAAAQLPVYEIADTSAARATLVSVNVSSAIAGDGISYRQVYR